jgi:hypothetical protein
MIVNEKIAEGQDGSMNTLGRVSWEDFELQLSLLESLGILKAGAVTVDEVMSDRYLPESAN